MVSLLQILNTVPEADTRGVLQEQVFLEILQNSQETPVSESLFFNKVAGFRPATLLKKRLWHRCFPVNFAKFLRTPFFTEHLRTTASDCSILKATRNPSKILLKY